MVFLVLLHQVLVDLVVKARTVVLKLAAVDLVAEVKLVWKILDSAAEMEEMVAIEVALDPLVDNIKYLKISIIFSRFICNLM